MMAIKELREGLTFTQRSAEKDRLPPLKGEVAEGRRGL